MDNILSRESLKCYHNYYSKLSKYSNKKFKVLFLIPEPTGYKLIFDMVLWENTIFINLQLHYFIQKVSRLFYARNDRWLEKGIFKSASLFQGRQIYSTKVLCYYWHKWNLHFEWKAVVGLLSLEVEHPVLFLWENHSRHIQPYLLLKLLAL